MVVMDMILQVKPQCGESSPSYQSEVFACLHGSKTQLTKPQFSSRDLLVAGVAYTRHTSRHS